MIKHTCVSSFPKTWQQSGPTSPQTQHSFRPYKSFTLVLTASEKTPETIEAFVNAVEKTDFAGRVGQDWV
jgi:hypothetical protein